MKLHDIASLLESPANTFPTDFGLDDETRNKDFGTGLLKQHSKQALEQIGDFTLWEFKREYALIRNEDNYVAYYMQFRFDLINQIKRQCVRQITVWRSVLVSEQSGLAKRIFLNHLLKSYQTVITDAEQTPDGRRFWADRIRDCLSDGIIVYYLNIIAPREITQIHTMADYADIVSGRPAYGDETKFQHRRFVITSQPFKNLDTA